MDDNILAGSRQHTVRDENIPAGNRQRTVTHEYRSTGDEQCTVTDEYRPVGDRQRTVTDEFRPSTDGQCPNTGSNSPDRNILHSIFTCLVHISSNFHFQNVCGKKIHCKMNLTPTDKPRYTYEKFCAHSIYSTTIDKIVKYKIIKIYF